MIQSGRLSRAKVARCDVTVCSDWKQDCTHTQTRCTYLGVKQDFCLSLWVCLSGREYPCKVMWRISGLSSTSLENTEPLQLPCVQLDPKPPLPYFQQKDLLEYIGENAASLQWYGFTV